ncbi:MAG: hypothetical protein HWE20_09315 [Gammaproteobacteria bacterium]|nr:hypothetical protein [Gammaproteobacteria bacterium]
MLDILRIIQPWDWHSVPGIQSSSEAKEQFVDTELDIPEEQSAETKLDIPRGN